MEQLIHAFGIDGKLIIVQIINFLVLFGALTYFLYKPILKVLKEREDTIRQGILDAEKAAEAKASAEVEKRNVLTIAQGSAAEIVDRAQKQGKQKEEEILKIAHEKASLTLKDAEAKGASLQTKALKESEAEIAKLAILAAEKILKEKSA